jgi:hypothetical protein
MVTLTMPKVASLAVFHPSSLECGFRVLEGGGKRKLLLNEREEQSTDFLRRIMG